MDLEALAEHIGQEIAIVYNFGTDEEYLSVGVLDAIFPDGGYQMTIEDILGTDRDTSDLPVFTSD